MIQKDTAPSVHCSTVTTAKTSCWCCSVAKPRMTLRPHGLQHTSFLCPSWSPGVCSNSCPLSQWCHRTMSSSVIPFFCPQSFPVSGSFPMSWLFTSGGQSIGASALDSSSALCPGPSCYSVGYWGAGLEEVTLEPKGNKSITSLPDRHWSHI